MKAMYVEYKQVPSEACRVCCRIGAVLNCNDCLGSEVFEVEIVSFGAGNQAVIMFPDGELKSVDIATLQVTRPEESNT